jgi:hypothetical protein
MRVNVYAEELTEHVEILQKRIGENGEPYFGLRFYLYLPVTDHGGSQQRGAFVHRAGDDDSAAITIWARTVPELVTFLLGGVDALEEFKTAGAVKDEPTSETSAEAATED